MKKKLSREKLFASFKMLFVTMYKNEAKMWYKKLEIRYTVLFSL